METLFDGIYTIVSGRDGSHRTLRIRTQDETAKFLPGKQLVSILTGSNNETDYTSFAAIEEGALHTWRRWHGSDAQKIGFMLLGLLTKNPLGNMLYEHGYKLEESRICRKCHRRLTTPESIALGIGPECLKKG